MKSGFGFLNWNPHWERICRRWNPFSDATKIWGANRVYYGGFENSQLCEHRLRESPPSGVVWWCYNRKWEIMVTFCFTNCQTRRQKRCILRSELRRSDLFSLRLSEGKSRCQLGPLANAKSIVPIIVCTFYWIIVTVYYGKYPSSDISDVLIFFFGFIFNSGTPPILASARAVRVQYQQRWVKLSKKIEH